MTPAPELHPPAAEDPGMTPQELAEADRKRGRMLRRLRDWVSANPITALLLVGSIMVVSKPILQPAFQMAGLEMPSSSVTVTPVDPAQTQAIRDLTAQVQAVAGSVTSLKGDMASLQTQINNLQGAILDVALQRQKRAMIEAAGPALASAGGK